MAKLTKTLIEKTTASDAPFWLWDAGLPGFGVRILPSGTKSYAVKFREHGKQKLITLGPVGVVELDEARERAREIVQGIRLKRPLADVLGAHAGSPTIAELAKQHQAVAKVRPSTAEIYRIYWESHIVPRLGKREVASITKLDIETFHSSIKSIYSANRSVKVLSKAFNDMAGWGHPWPKIQNPCAGVKMRRESKTERILPKPLAKALHDELDLRVTENPFNYCAWLLMILQVTGQRTGEWRKTPWEWVDLELGEVRLPTTKANRARRVILSKPAIEILKRIPRTSKSRWIFPSIDNPKTFIGKPKSQWANIKSKLGIDPKFRVHDLRHSFASTALVDAKLSIKEVGELLGHSQLATTSRYLHLLDDQQKSAANQAAAAVLNFDS